MPRPAIWFAVLVSGAVCSLSSPAPAAGPEFTIELSVARQGFAGGTCWVHARAGAVPPGVPGNPGPRPQIVMTLQQLQLSGSDVFFALHDLRSRDGGATWTGPAELPGFGRRPFPQPGREGLEITVCDFWPQWHAGSGRLLGTGHTVVYENNAVAKVRPRATAYAVFDPATQAWSGWKTLAMPAEARFENAGAGCTQRVDLASGDTLLPVYFKAIEEPRYRTTVVRCRFDGETLAYVEHGSELGVAAGRGLYEPSLARAGGRFFLTLRNDEHGYVAAGDDGLHFGEPRPWTFDDGSDLGNYNTQQHWVTHGEALYLVYTRRGADNDHVFRHRAPLFIARVDPDKLQVIRATERVLVPERGARLGNFGVTPVGENEVWVTAAEWMQGPGAAAHDPSSLVARGADNRVWVAKLTWP